MAIKQFLTAESVTEGHPDKICDAIADCILDAILKDDKYGRVACEVFVSKGYVIVGGEITTKTWVDINNLVRGVIKEIGYTFETGKISDEKLLKIIPKVFDLSPGGMIKQLNLLRPIYQKTACYGHFGREDPDFTWEKTDKVAEILKHVH